MSWYSFPATAKKTAPAAGPNPTFYPLAITASATSICEGGRAVLTASGGYYSGDGAVTYTWTPDLTTSASSGSSIVVGPLESTTYTVTATGTHNGSPTSYYVSVAVTVSANCCEQAAGHGPLVQLTSNTYSVNPFTGPPGTRYHATGSLLLTGDVFALPVGGQLLLDNAATVTLDENAVLELRGGSISASCDDMWNRILVTGKAGGFRASAVNNLRAFIGHSYGGAEWEEPFSIVSTPFFQLQNVEFRENRQSLIFHRVTGSNTTDYVRNNNFTSTPGKFKGLYSYQSATNYYYSLRHIALDGKISPSVVLGNNFTNALFGIFSGTGDGFTSTLSTATLSQNNYSNIWLAGIYASDTPGKLNVNNSTFTFPTATALPATSQLTQAAQYLSNTTPTTYGIYSFNPTVATDHNVFSQYSTALYNTYNYNSYRTEQTGILGRNITSVENSTFNSLAVGLYTDMGGTATSGNSTNTLIRGNLFNECPLGCVLQGGALTGPSAASVKPFVTCNTFQALTYKGSTAHCTGIYIKPSSWVLLQDPTAAIPADAPLKNLVLDDSGQNGSQLAIDNPSNYYLKYVTFSNYYQDVYFYSLGNIQTFDCGYNPNATNNCSSDHFPDTGIQARSLGRLIQPANDSKTAHFLTQKGANPAFELTTFEYDNTTGRPSSICELVIRSLLTGQEVKRVVLSSSSGQYTLGIQGWKQGLYTATLVVDGAPRQNCRFAVSE